MFLFGGTFLCILPENYFDIIGQNLRVLLTYCISGFGPDIIMGAEAVSLALWPYSKAMYI